MHGYTDIKPIQGDQLQTLNEIIQFLKPIQSATEIFSGEKYVTGSECLPIIKNLKNRLEHLPATTNASKIFKKLLLDAFNNRFQTIENKPSITTATLLDPRYKKMYFENNVACSKVINNVAEMMSYESDKNKNLVWALDE